MRTTLNEYPIMATELQSCKKKVNLGFSDLNILTLIVQIHHPCMQTSLLMYDVDQISHN